MAGDADPQALHAPGVVSVWTAAVRDEDELFDHVAMEHGDDGSVRSAFLAESGIGWYDEDFAEGSVSSDPAAALADHSHAAGFAAPVRRDLAARPGVNALYLVYDLDAAPLAARTGLLRFLGAYPYDRQA